MKFKMYAACVLSLMSAVIVAAEPSPPPTQVKQLLTRPLGNTDGQEVTMLTVEIPPGAQSPPHRHNANTLVYVLEGTVVMQVRGGEEQTLVAGQTFYESPTDVHTVSRNPNPTVPAKILVVMVKPIGAPIVVPAQ